jgi:hypothetical protein
MYLYCELGLDSRYLGRGCRPLPPAYYIYYLGSVGSRNAITLAMGAGAVCRSVGASACRSVGVSPADLRLGDDGRFTTVKATDLYKPRS